MVHLWIWVFTILNSCSSSLSKKIKIKKINYKASNGTLFCALEFITQSKTIIKKKKKQHHVLEKKNKIM